MELPISEIEEQVFRIIATRYPQIDLFERVGPAESWGILYEVESLTNNRLKDEIGDIELVTPSDRVDGIGASLIMAAFTHPPVDGVGGRFNKDFGVYYCTPEEEVAIAETCFHRAKFYRESRIENAVAEMRVIQAYLGPINLQNICDDPYEEYHRPNDYEKSQRLGKALKEHGSYGIRYRSVRQEGGICTAVMRPKALSNAIHLRYLKYHYKAGEIIEVERFARSLS